MPAYIIARVDVTDPIRYRDYINATPGVIARYLEDFFQLDHGHVLVANLDQA